MSNSSIRVWHAAGKSGNSWDAAAGFLLALPATSAFVRNVGLDTLAVAARHHAY